MSAGSPVPLELLRARRLQLVIYSAFLDESGKFSGGKSTSVVSLGGVVGYEDLWGGFRDDWVRALKHLRLTGLTMKQALNHSLPLSDHIAALGLTARNKALIPFAECIKRHLRDVISVSVDCVAFGSLSPKLRSVLKDDPHYLAFLGALVDLRPMVGAGDQLSIICDEDEQTALQMYGLYRRVKQQSRGGRVMRSISFADDYEFPLLQAADMIASLSRLEVSRRIHGEKHGYGPLVQCLMSKGPGDKIQTLQFLLHGPDLEDKAKKFIEIRKRYGYLPIFDDPKFASFNGLPLQADKARGTL